MTIAFAREQHASQDSPLAVPLAADVAVGATLVVIASCLGDGTVTSASDTQGNVWGVFGANGLSICWAVNIATALSRADDSVSVAADGDVLDGVMLEEFSGPLSVQGASYSGRDGVDDPPPGWLSVFAFFADPDAGAQAKAKSSLTTSSFPSDGLGSRVLRAGYAIARATGDHWVSFPPSGGVTLSLSDSPPRVR